MAYEDFRTETVVPGRRDLNFSTLPVSLSYYNSRSVIEGNRKLSEANLSSLCGKLNMRLLAWKGNDR